MQTVLSDVFVKCSKHFFWVRSLDALLNHQNSKEKYFKSTDEISKSFHSALIGHSYWTFFSLNVNECIYFIRNRKSTRINEKYLPRNWDITECVMVRTFILMINNSKKSKFNDAHFCERTQMLGHRLMLLHRNRRSEMYGIRRLWIISIIMVNTIFAAHWTKWAMTF